MSRSILILLLVLGAVGTGCAFLIAGTYVILHIPLPFSVMLSCVAMSAALTLIGSRVRRAQPVPGGEYAFAYPAPPASEPPRTAREPRLLLLPAAGAPDDNPRSAKGETPFTCRRPISIRLDAITLFELPRVAQEQEAA